MKKETPHLSAGFPVNHRQFVFTMFNFYSYSAQCEILAEALSYIVHPTSYFVHCIPLVHYINIFHRSIRFSYFKLVHAMRQVIIPLDQICRIAAGMTELLLQY